MTNKIIYTSSSSIYGLYEDLKYIELDKYNRKIYAAIKVLVFSSYSIIGFNITYDKDSFLGVSHSF